VSQLAAPWSGGALLIIPGRSQRWQHAVKPDIGSESRFLPTPFALDTPVRGFPSEYCHADSYGKTRMVWLSDGGKNLKICLFVLTELTNVTDRHTDRRTDTAWRHRSRLHSMARRKGPQTGEMSWVVVYRNMSPEHATFWWPCSAFDTPAITNHWSLIQVCITCLWNQHPDSFSQSHQSCLDSHPLIFIHLSLSTHLCHHPSSYRWIAYDINGYNRHMFTPTMELVTTYIRPTHRCNDLERPWVTCKIFSS